MITMKFETKIEKLGIDENEVKSIIMNCECGKINGAYFIDLTKEKKEFIMEVIGNYFNMEERNDHIEETEWTDIKRIATFCKTFDISEDEIPYYYRLGFNEGGCEIAYELESNKDVLLVLTGDERYTNSFIKYSPSQAEEEPALIGIDENTGIQYQIMTDENKNAEGKYIPSFDELFREAETGATKMEWIECQRRMARRPLKFQGFTFNLVVMVKQACGHYEILQHPYHQEYDDLHEILTDFANENRKCTRCICG